MPFNRSSEGHIANEQEDSHDDSSSPSANPDSSRIDDSAKIELLGQQIARITERLDALSGEEEAEDIACLIAPDKEAAQACTNAQVRPLYTRRSSLPDAERIRMIIRHRQMRARFFRGCLFSDPAWDMLLDLAAAQIEGIKVSITSLCIASGVPDTTALRWINVMIEEGLFVRINDETDKRRVFIELTAKATRAIAEYFVETDLEWNASIPS